MLVYRNGAKKYKLRRNESTHIHSWTFTQFQCVTHESIRWYINGLTGKYKTPFEILKTEGPLIRP